MKIIVASQSRIKLDAVRAVFPDAEITGIEAKSGVPEQPFDRQVLGGARNRILDARSKAPGEDLYIAIENGLFSEKGGFNDYAVVIVESADGRHESIAFSRPVPFPADCVMEARARKTTAGKIMQERGIVKNHYDPHLCLTGISRTGILTQTLRIALDAYANMANMEYQSKTGSKKQCPTPPKP